MPVIAAPLPGDPVDWLEKIAVFPGVSLLRLHPITDYHKGDEGVGAEDPYESSSWENLVFRYEEPNGMSRWDSPLFTLIWEDAEARTRTVFDSIWESIAGESRKQVKPNQVAIQRGKDAGGDYLYVLDRETQEIVKQILEQQDNLGVGCRVKIPKSNSKGDEAASLELPGQKVGLPLLQRYRRAFLGLNRGGIGLEGMGSMGVTRIREAFVGYLNDAFEKED